MVSSPPKQLLVILIKANNYFWWIPNFSCQRGCVGSYYGVEASKSFVYGAAWNMYFLLKLVFTIYTKEINDLKTVVSMLSCDVHERGHTPFKLKAEFLYFPVCISLRVFVCVCVCVCVCACVCVCSYMNWFVGTGVSFF